MESKSNRMAFGSYLVDLAGKRLTTPEIPYNSSVTNNFFAGGYFEEDANFNLILLKNFEQIEFSIDNKTKAKVHNISFKKSDKSGLTFYKHSLELDNIKDDFNDFILVFSRQYDEKQLEYYLKNNISCTATFTSRFCVTKNNSNLKSNIIVNNNYKILKNTKFALFNIFAYNKEFDSFENNTPPSYNILRNIKASSGFSSFPMSINTGTFIDGSPYYDKYLEDEKLNKKENIAVFSILNGQLTPVCYGDLRGEKELVHFYEKNFKDVIMIKPTIEVKNKGINTYSLICACYPLSTEYKNVETYKLAKWNTVIASDSILISN